jgi:hypothetical protein
MPVLRRSLSATTVARLATVFFILGFAPGIESRETTLRVRELRALHPTHGTFTVLGYLSQAYHCPPCPVGTYCDPCLGPHAVLSDARHHADSYEHLGAADIIVFATDSELANLVLGKRYRMRVEVEPTHTTSLHMHDLKLLTVELAGSR